jgi:hypothetical protein
LRQIFREISFGSDCATDFNPIAFLDWLSGFIEYDYYRFRNDAQNFVCTPAAACGGFPLLPVSFDTNVNVVKVGVNLRFGPGTRWY